MVAPDQTLIRSPQHGEIRWDKVGSYAFSSYRFDYSWNSFLYFFNITGNAVDFGIAERCEYSSYICACCTYNGYCFYFCHKRSFIHEILSSLPDFLPLCNYRESP